MQPAQALAALLSAALLIMAAGALERANAATFTVNTTADQVDAAPGNGACAAAGGGCSLRAAVQEANAFAGADVILLPAGVFAITRAGAGEDASATGDLDVTETVSIAGEGAGVTVVDARGLDRALDVPYSFSSPADLMVEDLTITGGEVTSAPGGGVHFGSSGVAHLVRVELRDNHAHPPGSDATGGGVSSNGGGTLYVTASRIADGSADRGGAVFNNGTVYVEDSTIAGNAARAGSALVDYGTAVIRRSTLRGNRSTGNNSIAANGETLTIEDSTLSGNPDPAPLVVVLTGTAALRNATIAGNPVHSALSVSTGATATLVDTIVWNDPDTVECLLSGGGTITSLGHNLDSDGSCATTGTDLPGQDPLLGGLAANGGPTATRWLRPGSPAIDAGDAASCTATDQRGVARPLDGDGVDGAVCDIGAVEVPEPPGASLAAAALAALLACARGRRDSAA